MKYLSIVIDDVWNIRLWVDVANYADLKGFHTCFAMQTSDLTSREWKTRKIDYEFIRPFAELGHEICSHSVSHVWNLETLPDEDLDFELRASKEAMELGIGKEVKTVVYPHGFYGPRTISKALELGYTAGRAVFDGKVNGMLANADPMRIDTVNAQGGLGYINGKYDLEERLHNFINRRDYTVLLGHKSERFSFYAWKRVIDELPNIDAKVVTLSELGEIIRCSTSQS